MADTRFILSNLRQLLTRLDDHARSMSRTRGAPGIGPGLLRDHASFVHGIALLAVRQAMFDVFEAHAPDGAADWPRHFVPLLRDFDVTSLPIDDSSSVTAGTAVPASAGLAVYAGAACFVGILSCRFAPTSSLTAEGWIEGDDRLAARDDGLGTASLLAPELVKRLRSEGVVSDAEAPFLDLVSALATGGGITDLVDVVAVWDRRVAAFAREVSTSEPATSAG